MRSKFSLLLLILMFSSAVKAQTVTIPDPNFVTWLQSNYPSCMNGNLMDTTCPAIQNAAYVYISYSNISDLTGIQYFRNLQTLYCNDNQISALPPLPNTLRQLGCSSNMISYLMPLPDSLVYLNCYNNQLTSLPSLPNTLTELWCSINMLTSLPTLPMALCSLKCDHNQLTTLPALPPSLTCGLECNDNNITCFPAFPENLGYIVMGGNPFTCVPNNIPAMGTTFPLCMSGDTVNNPAGCSAANGITGFVYHDNNNNCIYDPWTTETGINHVPLKIYDSVNNLIGQTYSFSNGTYQFTRPAGTYRVEIDTTGLPFMPQCATPGTDSLVVIPASSPLLDGLNFDLKCKPGFDLGVQSIVYWGRPFPGQTHRLSVTAGDMNDWYNLNCSAGVSGQVVITVTGPVTYAGVALGALTPAISGNVYTYTIADFASINSANAFALNFTTNVNAVAGNQICVTASIGPSSGDNNTLNNTVTHCFYVVNSYDPNFKEVYPVDVETGFQDWLTYTIHFQNTGNAPAINIRLEDTLSANLDLSTFQVMNYSHFNTSVLDGNSLVFNFPNIQLADSASDPEGSKGFVQYRIKPKAGLVTGTTIENTAFIYFDYNPAVITNTTLNQFVSALAVNENAQKSLIVYPNPGAGNYHVDLGGFAGKVTVLEVCNLLGEIVWKGNAADTQIDLSAEPDGIYILKVSGGGSVLSKRLIKQ